MRTWVECDRCIVEFPNSDSKVIVELNDKLLFEAKCDRGHPLLYTLETTRFSLLFDFGISAFFDGYYREAVSSFAASLERLHEYCIRVICKKNGVEFETMELGWKCVAAQSERQVGAFYMLYLQEAKEPPTLLPQWQIEFRNNVIHKGYLPSKKDTMDYAKSVHDNMMKIAIFMYEKFEEHSTEVWVEERARRAGTRDRQMKLRSMSHAKANFVPRIPDAARNKTFEEKLRMFEFNSPMQRWIFT